MSTLAVRSFDAGDVADAGALLAERHRRHRAAAPLLSPRFELVEAATAEVRAALAVPHASGAIAHRGDEVVGFLLGAPKSAPTWGRNVWVEAAGQATREAEVMRDLYGFAATRWVREGRTAHYALVPANDPELVGAWFRLGFGQQHVHGLRPATKVDVAPRVTIRPAVRADIPVLARLDLELPLHQAKAPTLSAGRVGTVEEYQAEWEVDFDNPAFTTFVAESDGVVIGSAVGAAITESSAHTGLARPDNAGFLGFACVLPSARGAGAGRALGAAVINWAVEAGFASVVTDWRATNLTSSRAWPTLGFAESFLRLHRHIGY